MKAPNAWSCVPTAFAMATHQTVDSILKLFPDTTPEQGYCLEDGVVALLKFKPPMICAHVPLYGPDGSRDYRATVHAMVARPYITCVLGLESLGALKPHAVLYEREGPTATARGPVIAPEIVRPFVRRIQ